MSLITDGCAEIRNAIYDLLCDDIITDNRAPGFDNTLVIEFQEEVGHRPLTVVRLCRQVSEEFIARLIHRCGPVDLASTRSYGGIPTLVVKTDTTVAYVAHEATPDQTAHSDQYGTLNCVVDTEFYDKSLKTLLVSLVIPCGNDLTALSETMITGTLTRISGAHEDLSVQNCFIALAQLLALDLAAVRVWRSKHEYNRKEVVFRVSSDFGKGGFAVQVHRRSIDRQS